MLLNSVKINNGIKTDFFHLEEVSDINDDIFEVNNYKPLLNNSSRFLVTFDDLTLTSQGVSSEALDYKFSVYREENQNNILKYVATIEEGALSMKDYNVGNNTDYRYYIFKEGESAISEATISNEITTCWEDWSIVDLVPSVKQEGVYYVNTKSIWKFNSNVSSGQTSQNTKVTVYDNFSRYPKVSVGEPNYARGNLTCLLGNVTVIGSAIQYYEPKDLLEEWNQFAANGNIKLLKDRRGNTRLVIITETNSNIDDVTRQQETTISFSWVEVDNASKIGIIGGV